MPITAAGKRKLTESIASLVSAAPRNRRNTGTGSLFHLGYWQFTGGITI